MAKRKAKRGNGEGTIFQMPDGRWKAEISLGRDSNGRRRRRSRIARTRADAAALLREMQNNAGINRPEPTKSTVADFLNRWLDIRVKPNRAESTHALWKHSVDKHLAPRLGAIRLDRFTALDVEQLLSDLSAASTKPRMKQVAFEVLRNAMSYAESLGLIASNPCTRVEKPKHESGDILPFTAEEANRILKDVAETRLHPFFLLAFQTGMRQSELFGLRWEFVDLKAATVRVEWQASDVRGRVSVKRPKTRSSIRTIAITPAAVAALGEHRKALFREGHGCSKTDLVFPAKEGGYMTRGNFRVRVWSPLLKRLKLSHRGFHHVRHTYATIALGEDVPLATVAQILGHSKPSTTLNTYSHALKTHQAAATEKMARIFAS